MKLRKNSTVEVNYQNGMHSLSYKIMNFFLKSFEEKFTSNMRPLIDIRISKAENK